MSMRRRGARLESLCGTARRMKKEEDDALLDRRNRPCRYPGIWACQGEPDRSRRLAAQTRQF